VVASDCIQYVEKQRSRLNSWGCCNRLRGIIPNADISTFPLIETNSFSKLGSAPGCRIYTRVLCSSFRTSEEGRRQCEDPGSSSSGGVSRPFHCRLLGHLTCLCSATSSMYATHCEDICISGSFNSIAPKHVKDSLERAPHRSQEPSVTRNMAETVGYTEPTTLFCHSLTG
jgi:hypothetical protein